MTAIQVGVTHKVVDGWHVFTSKDVPELYSANLDRDLAWSDIPASVALFRRLKGEPLAQVRVVELETA